MRFLFATTRGGGHVGPLVPFARAAVAAGHDVVVRATLEFASALAAERHGVRRCASGSTSTRALLLTIGDRRDPAELGPLPPSVRGRALGRPVRRDAARLGDGRPRRLRLDADGAGRRPPARLRSAFVDGPANARRVAELGAGIALEDGPGGVGRAVEELLGDPGYRAAAHSLAEQMRALPPVEAAVAGAGAGRPAGRRGGLSG